MDSQPILVTGATGLVGHHLTRALLETGYAVRALHRTGSNTNYLPIGHKKLELFEGDILDIFRLEEAMIGCRKIIHAAAFISFRSADRKKLDQVNIDGTANVVNLALEQGVERLVYISSVAALGRESGSVQPTSLDDSWQPKRAATNYAASKFAAEREVWRGQAEGLAVSTVYPSVVVGSGDPERGGTPALFERIKSGQSTYSTGSSAFVAVADVVDACLYLLQLREDKRILCHGHNMSWQEFLSLVAQELGVSPPTKAIQPWQSGLAWPVANLWSKVTGSDPFLTKDRHRLAHAHYAYEGDSFEKELGRPFREIEEALNEATQNSVLPPA
ncbi:MAG: NAD-dependent epimerase/dehydratase family protein [Bacteroidota bacterium]